MSLSLIKILSCCIFIAQEQNNKILAILIKDYAKTIITNKEFALLLFFVACYKKENIFKHQLFYRILDKYLDIYSNHICKHLIYYDINK